MSDEQEAIARLRGPKKQMNTIRIAPGHWQTAVIVGEQDLRALLDSHERMRKALTKYQWRRDVDGLYCVSCTRDKNDGRGHLSDCEIREALEGKQ